MNIDYGAAVRQSKTSKYLALYLEFVGGPPTIHHDTASRESRPVGLRQLHSHESYE